MSRPGRSCPLSYRYGAAAVRLAPEIEADTVWIAGGLYGNPFALERLLELYDAEPGAKALVFNGDFHWFDVDPADFREVNERVLGFHATRGNVETELATPGEGAGCGCGYPDWVGETTVEHSNRIIERLRATARGAPHASDALGKLPMYLAARVGDARVAIVHGDADSLAGWGFSQESLSTPQGLIAARMSFEQCGARIIASSHTCLPVLQRFNDAGVIVNNGAAGMPNFAGESYGLATRISTRPHPAAVYATRLGRVHVEAMALRYDARQWQARFRALWPEGSDANRSYWQRIAHGPEYRISQALRAA